MADPNIQTLIYPMSVGPGIIRTYQTEVNKKTGSSVTYDVTNLGQKDAVWRSEREVDSNSGKVFYRAGPAQTTYYENLSSDLKKFIQNDLAYQSDNQRAAFINKNYTPTQRQQLFAGMPKVQNTAKPPPEDTNKDDSEGGITREQIKAAGVDVINVDIPGKNAQTPGYMGTHVYPSDLRSNQQDRLKFTLYESLGADISAEASEIFKSDFSGKVISQRRSTTLLGEVYLPIQPSITDSNNVDWSGTSLNAFEAAAFGKSLGLMGEGNVTQAAGRIFNEVKEAAKLLAGGNNPVAQTLKVLLAQEAVGIQGVLSRATGAVLNPNLELLFNGPMLRPFNFTFRLSPRDKPEADEVRKIIRFFKEAMSVRTASSNVFLKTPNVFDIQFQVGENNSPHKSLPRIKRCALLSCDVDYTPDGTYMTYLDAAKTLTSYQLSLRFSELEPIYDSDYKTIPRDEIGF